MKQIYKGDVIYFHIFDNSNWIRDGAIELKDDFNLEEATDDVDNDSAETNLVDADDMDALRKFGPIVLVGLAIGCAKGVMWLTLWRKYWASAEAIEFNFRHRPFFVNSPNCHILPSCCSNDLEVFLTFKLMSILFKFILIHETIVIFI